MYKYLVNVIYFLKMMPKSNWKPVLPNLHVFPEYFSYYTTIVA